MKLAEIKDFEPINNVLFNLNDIEIALDDKQSKIPNVRLNLFLNVFESMLRSKYPNGIGREPRKLLAGCQKSMVAAKLQSEIVEVIEFSGPQISFIEKILTDGTLNVPIELAQATEAITDYIKSLIKE